MQTICRLNRLIIATLAILALSCLAGCGATFKIGYTMPVTVWLEIDTQVSQTHISTTQPARAP